MKIINLNNTLSNDLITLENIGGKAFNLHKLIQKNFSVPKTYVLGVKFFSDIKYNIERAITIIPKNRIYAIRSSGTSEDSTNFSYAGMYDSFLNIYPNQITQYVKQCLSSSTSKRLLTYEQNISKETGNLAVIIQEMVQSDFSGILFTSNSINKNKEEMILEIGIGYGDKIVSGEVTPATYIIDKKTHDIKSSYNLINDLTFEVYTVLFTQLLNEALKIEDMFGYPVDIEWSIANGKLYILQARPIVNL